MAWMGTDPGRGCSTQCEFNNQSRVAGYHLGGNPVAFMSLEFLPWFCICKGVKNSGFLSLSIDSYGEKLKKKNIYIYIYIYCNFES